VRLTSPTSRAECHEIWPSGPHRACYGTALPLTVFYALHKPTSKFLEVHRITSKIRKSRRFTMTMNYIVVFWITGLGKICGSFGDTYCFYHQWASRKKKNSPQTPANTQTLFRTTSLLFQYISNTLSISSSLLFVDVDKNRPCISCKNDYRAIKMTKWALKFSTIYKI